MTTHHCGTYKTSPYCNCFNQTGEDKHHYKQFHIDTQTYNCCDQITNSLNELRPVAGGAGNAFPSAQDFFTNTAYVTMSGCCYDPYLTNPETGTQDIEYFQVNYTELYHNYVGLASLYNTFLKDTTAPTMNGNNVTCEPNNYPFILSYRAPNQTYYNYSFICSSRTNNVFPSIAVAYGDLDYKITRFHDNSTGKPCINRTCQLITDNANYNNFGDVTNQGNNSSVYNNKQNSEKGGFIASGVLAILLFLVGIYVFYIIHKQMRTLEDQRLK